ncbi:MAG TPA: 2,3-bisphosphoglycerate-independent phosphoglycerate mutase [Gemmatimonadaceae bacterium]|nr:2,3-bisphosphoglycerate-independent phosphoglycerate mutase [Gemmatimonadaceae bacterium]
MAGSVLAPVVLVVLDGWGYRAEREGNAIALATTPTWDALWRRPSRTLLEASGLRVGLPAGQMGNSEVGHLNLGAGRVVMQDLVRIDTAIADRSFQCNGTFLAACHAVRRTGGTLHLVGLLGEGGVHAADRHLYALLDLTDRQNVPRVAIHAMLDGRDTLPKSALGYMRNLTARVARATVPTVIGSVGGRYYGMDRDRRWQRTELAYRAMVDGVGPSGTDPLSVIRAAYENGQTDEFILPTVIPGAPMKDGDAVICFNFRSDRMRQIVRAMTEPAFKGFDVAARPELRVVTMTSYAQQFALSVAFPPQSMARIVAEVLSAHGKAQFRTAETEKYPHVTYFFNGGEETPYAGEERLLVPSQKVATYDLMPEMSAPGVTDVLCAAIEKRQHEFILCNYANGDMVGHTGSLPATIKAVETVDQCLGRVLAAAERSKTEVLVTADHGNCELMIDPETGGPHTAHTTNPVPFIHVGGEGPLRAGAALQDVGPTILGMLGIRPPSEMTGVDLRDP